MTKERAIQPREDIARIGPSRPHLLPPFKINKKNTALLIIDMQYLDAHWDYGYLRQLRDQGHEAKVLYLKNRLQMAIPNIQRLQGKFREKKMEVIHARIQSLTMDGRDRSLMHKALKIFAPPNSKEAEILEEVKPVGDEIVLNKTCSTVFVSTNIDYILRHMGIKGLVMAGMMNSVEATARDAYELGFYTKVVEDACCAMEPAFQKQSVEMINHIYGETVQVNDILETIEEL